MRGLLLVLVALPGWAQPLLTSEVAAGVGVQGASYTAVGARLGDTFLIPMVSARGVFGGFVIEGGVFTTSPITNERASFGVTGGLRAGYSGQRWSVVAGAVAQFAPDALPNTLFLPSLRGQVSFGQVGLTLGVFDQLGLVPAHLSVDLGPWEKGQFSIGWVAPLGLIATGTFIVHQTIGVRVTAFAFRLANTETAMVLLSGTWGLR